MRSTVSASSAARPVFQAPTEGSLSPGSASIAAGRGGAANSSSSATAAASAARPAIAAMPGSERSVP